MLGGTEDSFRRAGSEPNRGDCSSLQMESFVLLFENDIENEHLFAFHFL